MCGIPKKRAGSGAKHLAQAAREQRDQDSGSEREQKQIEHRPTSRIESRRRSATKPIGRRRLKSRAVHKY
jgi:hypothetical protein